MEYEKRVFDVQSLEEFREKVVLGPPQKRALQADSDTSGGYLVGGAVMNELLVQEGKASRMRAMCRVLSPLGEGIDEIGVPSQEAQMADAEWTSELEALSDDTTAAFGNRVLHPHPMRKLAKASRKLMRVATTAEQWIIEALADAVATPQEQAFIQGSGSGEPLGLLNTEGLPVYTTSVSGAVNGDEIREWIFSLPNRFQERARILTTVDFLRHILTLQDGQGAYLFPDYRGELLGKRVVFSDGMPDIESGGSLIAGEYAAVIGDFYFYWIVDSEGFEVQKLGELFAETSETGFIINQETDGMAVLANAFYALKIKA